MRAYVNELLAPLWRQFYCAHTVRVMFAVEKDPDGPSYPLIRAITYLDTAAMARGLASPARYEPRDTLPNFFAKFIARSVFPDAVGPKRKTIGLSNLFIREHPH